MIEHLVNVITTSAKLRQIVPDEDLSIFRYGLLSMFEVLTVTLTIALLAWWSTLVMETAVWLSIVIAGRTAAGGYHAQTFRGCYMISVSVFLVTLLILNAIPDKGIETALYLCWALSALLLAGITARKAVHRPVLLIHLCILGMAFVSLWLHWIHPVVLACSLGFITIQLSALFKTTKERE